MNPYQQFVSDITTAVQKAQALPLGEFKPMPRPTPASGAPEALFFAPHPDDECITGGLGVRLLRQAGMKVFNVAVTHGSKKERQAERLRELRNACGPEVRVPAWVYRELTSSDDDPFSTPSPPDSPAPRRRADILKRLRDSQQQIHALAITRLLARLQLQ